MTDSYKRYEAKFRLSYSSESDQLPNVFEMVGCGQNLTKFIRVFINGENLFAFKEIAGKEWQRERQRGEGKAEIEEMTEERER